MVKLIIEYVVCRNILKYTYYKVTIDETFYESASLLTNYKNLYKENLIHNKR